MTILRERNVKQLIESKDYKGIEQARSQITRSLPMKAFRMML